MADDHSGDIGKEAEEKAKRALRFLADSWDEIVCFHHSKRSGELDELHTDFLILLRSKLSLQLQIKSNPRGIRKHIQKYPFIIVISVTKRDKIEKVAKRIKRLIIRCYKRISALHPIN